MKGKERKHRKRECPFEESKKANQASCFFLKFSGLYGLDIQDKLGNKRGFMGHSCLLWTYWPSNLGNKNEYKKFDR